jgi:exodeoxyribonuclease VII small subunit
MTAKKPAKNSSFEDALRRLEQIVESLEQGSVPLDKALDLYEEGVKLSQECADRLRSAEQRIKKLTKAADGKFTESDLDEA